VNSLSEQYLLAAVTTSTTKIPRIINIKERKYKYSHLPPSQSCVNGKWPLRPAYCCLIILAASQASAFLPSFSVGSSPPRVEKAESIPENNLVAVETTLSDPTFRARRATAVVRVVKKRVVVYLKQTRFIIIYELETSPM
jgi:hypothetical protein